MILLSWYVVCHIIWTSTCTAALLPVAGLQSAMPRCIFSGFTDGVCQTGTHYLIEVKSQFFSKQLTQMWTENHWLHGSNQPCCHFGPCEGICLSMLLSHGNLMLIHFNKILTVLPDFTPHLNSVWTSCAVTSCHANDSSLYLYSNWVGQSGILLQQRLVMEDGSLI